MHIYHYANYCFNVLMKKTISDIRRSNLEALIAESKLAKGKFAEKIETSPAYLSQIMSETTKRDMGNDLARKIEAKLGKPHGWMDTDQQPIDPLFVAIDELSRYDRETIARNVFAMLGKQANIDERDQPTSPPARLQYDPNKEPHRPQYKKTEDDMREKDKRDSLDIENIVIADRRQGIDSAFEAKEGRTVSQLMKNLRTHDRRSKTDN